MTEKTQSKAKQSRDAVVKEMADRVLEALERGDKAWNKPWDTSKCTSGLAHNVISKKAYRGANQFYLSMVSSDLEFGTFNNWKEMGRRHAIKQGEWEWAEDKNGKAYKKPTKYYGIQKGEKAYTVIYFTIIKVEDKDDPDKINRIPILKWFKVFGRSQTDIPAPPPPEINPDDMPSISDYEQEIIDSVHEWRESEGISFAEGGTRAYYRYSADHIQMPDLVAFPSGFSYLPTLFHESVHATGHMSRLDRKMGMGFGSDDYAFEELVAEMGASILCRHHNILPSDPLEDGLENQVAYLASWCKRIKKNPKLLISAGSKAQKAVDMILGTTFDNKEEEKKDDK
jgi:antirestriction protein ArdC